MKKSTERSDRRTFIKTSAAAAAGITLGTHALSAPIIQPHWGANDKIRVGFIGVGNRGSKLLNWFMENDDVEVAALCDVYEPYVLRDASKVHPRYKAAGKTPPMGERLGAQVQRYGDFRRLLEQKDIDAVCIATPDHWHAIQAIMAMDAGKDIYVEKPLTIALCEGRKMVEAQRRTGRVAAVGLNRRGSSVYRELAAKVQDGLLGKVTTARAMRMSNMYPNGIGRLSPEAPPKDFDWDAWLGPRPYRDYQYNIAPYFFRWWKDYSSQMGNWGVHYMDVIRWLIGEKAPVAITAHGGKYVVQDDRDIPDTVEVLFEFASGAIVKFSIHEASNGQGVSGGEIELNGTQGFLTANERGYRLSPARPGQFQDWEKTGDILEKNRKDRNENSSANLIRNFLDCIKSREAPFCTLEDGHRSTSFAHLANIALEMGQKIEWDPEREVITNLERANELLDYDYRKPWRI